MFLLTIHYENSMAWACTMVATCSDRKHCQEKAGDILHQIVSNIPSPIDIKVIAGQLITDDWETETLTITSEVDEHTPLRNLQYDAGWFILETHNQENRYCGRYDEIVEVWQVFTLS